MRCESQEMTMTPLEVLVPQECPPEVHFLQVCHLVQEGTLPIHLEGKVSASLV